MASEGIGAAAAVAMAEAAMEEETEAGATEVAGVSEGAVGAAASRADGPTLGSREEDFKDPTRGATTWRDGPRTQCRMGV